MKLSPAPKPWPSPLAERLYLEVARDLPIIDFHNHLDAARLAADQPFRDLAQLWVESDPYKHRLMRMAGVPEHEITGGADPRTKFERWAETVPHAFGNPLYAWTRLELASAFGIAEPLTPATADTIWSRANRLLADPDHRPRALIEKARVACLCTSDSMADQLGAHRSLARSGWGVRVLPSLRADDVLAFDEPAYAETIGRIGRSADMMIDGWETFLMAVQKRLDAFDASGCRLADHSWDGRDFTEPDFAAVPALFTRALKGDALAPDEAVALRSALLMRLASGYARRGWTLQLHLGAQRHTSSRLRSLTGRFGGYATIGNPADPAVLCRFLDALEKGGHLPRTILYPLDPAQYPALATLTGSFAEDGVPGKIQLGPAWWFNDHDSGIRAHLDALSRYGLLSAFIGMTTDSRSILSMVRHDYFRRTLCRWLGEQIAAGELPDDFDALAGLVRALCHDNAARYLGFL